MADELPDDHPLRRMYPNTPIIHRPPKYSFPNLANDGPATLIDQDEDVETYLFGGARMECGKCGKWTWHDIFVEVTGLVEIQAETHANCRDCGARQKGSVKEGIGSIEPTRMGITPRDPKAKAIRKAARKARKANR